MARIPRSVINRVKSSTNIVDVIGRYLHLSRSGKNLFAHCPFHEDRTPSFSVSPGKQIFHCFSCGRGGNVFQFLMDYKHLSFPEAVVTVAKQDGIRIASRYFKRTSPRRPVNRHAQKLIQICNWAAKMYHYLLRNSKVGEPALNYLHHRGIDDQTIDAYNLGYAPKKPLLKKWLSIRQVNAAQMRQSGLFVENSRGQLRDRFFNRVMYPIRNRRGQTIAFSGRVLKLESSPAKYLNSPETPIFHKRDVIFNLDVALRSIHQDRSVILYEGYMDVLSAYQSGVKNGIASMGTGLTDNQIRLIERISPRIWVCYDGDLPGQRAINRALNLLVRSRLQVGVIQMPNGIDPDEYRQKYGEQQFKRYMRTAQESPVAFELRFNRLGLNLSDGKDQLIYLQKAARVIATLPNALKRDVYVRQVAQLTRVPSGDLKSQVARLLTNRQSRLHSYGHGRSFGPQFTSTKPVKITMSRVELAEQLLLHRMLTNHNVWLEVTGIRGFSFVGVKYQMIYQLAEAYFTKHSPANYRPDDFVRFTQRAGLASLVNEINHFQVPDRIGKTEIRDCVRIIKDDAPIKQRLRTEELALNEAARLKNSPKEQRLLGEIINLKKRLSQSQSNR